MITTTFKHSHRANLIQMSRCILDFSNADYNNQLIRCTNKDNHIYEHEHFTTDESSWILGNNMLTT